MSTPVQASTPAVDAEHGLRTYEINEVARLTGLAPARLRAWERRYEIVRPQRQPNGYRAYTSDQVALLRALARLIAAGERVGDLAELPPAEILRRSQDLGHDGSPLSALLDATKALDRDRFEHLVAQQLALRGLGGFAREVAIPLAQAVGDLWALGKLPIAAEHMASEVVLQVLKSGLRMSRGNGPLALCACLPGERHEWGVLCALTTVHERGWRVQYLGADLPVDDIIEAAWTLSPAAIALSASDPATIQREMTALAALPGRLPPRTLPVIGGGGAERHAAQLEHLGYRIGLSAFNVQGPPAADTNTRESS